MNRFDLFDFDIFDYEQPGTFEKPFNAPDRTMMPIQNELNALRNLADPRLETEDPTPDIWEMFRDFDQRFFNGTLVNNGVEVSWSAKMTSCAGLCRWRPNASACEIKLSKPLLQLRSRKDLVETLIHEMIHALLFVTRDSDNRESHGPKFHQHMYRINKEASLNISVYHTFHDEVRHYQTHVWRCKGICRQRSPFYGWVNRSMNRKPGPSDTWWSQHQQTCGGDFEKVSEPENFGKKKKQTKPAKENQPIISSKANDIRNFFSSTKTNSVANQPLSSDHIASLGNTTVEAPRIVNFDPNSPDKNDLKTSVNLVPFSGEGRILGGSSIDHPHPGKSILLLKFDNRQKNKSSSTMTNATDSNFMKKEQSSSLSSSISDRTKSSPSKSDELVDLVSPPSERKLLNETLVLSDDEEDFFWLDELTNDQILEESSCLVID